MFIRGKHQKNKKKKGSTDFENKGLGVVYAWEGISTPPARHKG